MNLAQIDPVALSIGSLQLRWYGLMYLAGFGLGWALGRWRAAICAAPAVVLLHHDLLGDASATCHPGFQARLPAAQLSTARVVRDDAHRLITSQGPGTAIEFALELVRVLRGDEAARAVAGPMVLP